MRLDCHIHSKISDCDRTDIISNMKAGGFDGGIIFSHSPSRGLHDAPSPEERIDAVLKICENQKYLFPFLFIDPTEPDAVAQVELADKKGIMGFKVICSQHFPCDERALPVYRKIAELNKPLMFHSGILYDGRNASGNYNRPCNFEGLLSIDNLRFSLAHVSWPWTDECIAVYGKFNSSRSRENSGSGEMFIDLTPGTPRPYRKPMYDMLLFAGYNIKSNLLYGIDNSLSPYSSGYAKDILDYDESVFDNYYKNGGIFGRKLDDDFKEHLYYLNMLRFIGFPQNY
ncbi:MAG: amidohydrolase [Oscillospiraceae bacterium]|nr:amidohydrolase [Oscillospiraceae bacterium]